MRSASPERTSCFLIAVSSCIIQAKPRQSRKQMRWCSLIESQPYQVGHPVEGGNPSLSIRIDEQTLFELLPADVLHTKDRTPFNRPRMRIDARAQLLAALVRHRLTRGMMRNS